MPKSASDPLADRRVRQALNMAVDVNAIVDNLFNGLGRRQSSPIMDGALGNDPSLAPYDYNPTFARQLLADAGYPNGFSATMDLASSDNPNEALAVIGQLQQVGITVKPQTFEVGTFNANWSQDKSGDLRMARWAGLQDPANFLNFTTVCGGYLADEFACDPGRHQPGQTSRGHLRPGRPRPTVLADRPPAARQPDGHLPGQFRERLRRRSPSERLAWPDGPRLSAAHEHHPPVIGVGSRLRT